MYKIIIADDEPFIRQGLIDLIEWEVYGIEITAEACDGLKAYLEIKEKKPDIALIDISMPNMSGIELIEACSRLDSRPKFIVLSGYSDFEYVKKSMQMGAVNYLLKPVNREELINTVCSTVQQLNDAAAQKQQFRESLEALKNDTLNRILTNRIEAREIKEKCRLLQLSFHCNAMYAVLIRPLFDNADPALRHIIFCGIEIAESYFSDNLPCYVLADVKDNIAVICKDQQQRLSTKDIVSHLEACAALMSHQLSCPVITALGSKASGIQELPGSYQHALRHLGKKIPLGDSSAFNGNTSKGQYSFLIQNALSYIHDNYADCNISLKTLAGQMKVNAAYLGQQFAQETGEYFSDYLNHIRISHAVALLRDTTLKAVTVAEKVGFSNITYFFTIFKKITGERPGDYRKNL